METQDMVPVVLRGELEDYQLSFLRTIMEQKIMSLKDCASKMCVLESEGIPVSDLCFKIGRGCDDRGGDGRWFKRNKKAVTSLARVVKQKIYPVSDRLMGRDGSEIVLVFSRFEKEFKAVYRKGHDLLDLSEKLFVGKDEYDFYVLVRDKMFEDCVVFDLSYILQFGRQKIGFEDGETIDVLRKLRKVGLLVYGKVDGEQELKVWFGVRALAFEMEADGWSRFVGAQRIPSESDEDDFM